MGVAVVGAVVTMVGLVAAHLFIGTTGGGMVRLELQD